MTLIGTAAVLQHVPTQMAVPLQVVTSVAEHTAHSAVTVVMSSQAHRCSLYALSSNIVITILRSIAIQFNVLSTLLRLIWPAASVLKLQLMYNAIITINNYCPDGHGVYLSLSIESHVH